MRRSIAVALPENLESESDSFLFNSRVETVETLVIVKPKSRKRREIEEEEKLIKEESFINVLCFETNIPEEMRNETRGLLHMKLNDELSIVSGRNCIPYIPRFL